MTGGRDPIRARTVPTQSSPLPPLRSRYLVRELDSISIVGAGRLGFALGAALRSAGRDVTGPLGRGAAPAADALVLLCVPDGEIAAAAGALEHRDGRLVGHCSGATGLDVLAPHEAFSLHPLMTVPADAAP